MKFISNKSIFCLTVIIVYCSSFFHALAQCRLADSLVLVDIYQSTSGINWENTWDLETPINTWFGISLDESGCVIKIDLETDLPNGNNLVGGIPDIDLPHLKVLNLSNNNLFGDVGVLTLPNIDSLNLSHNNLSGKIPDLSTQNGIELLDFSYNRFNELPNYSGFNNNNSAVLQVEVNNFTNEDLIPSLSLGEQFSYDPQQLFYHADTIYISEGGSYTIDLEIDEAITNNVYWWVSQNFSFQTNSNKIEFVNFSSQLAGEYTVVVENPDVATTLYSHTIDIRLAPPTCQADSLALVELYNATNGEQWVDKWNLENRIVEWEGVELNDNGCVERLTLFRRNLKGTLPNLNLPELKYLKIDYNPDLTGAVSNFSNSTNLEVLSLQHNGLIEGLPDLVLPKLISLTIVGNELMTGEIPDFTYFSNVKYLSIYGNALTGNIPNFSNLAAAEYMHINEDKLTGSIPNFSNLLSVENLVIGGEQLTGIIPDFSLLDPAKIKDIAIVGANISGEFPDWSALINLEAIAIVGTKVSGNIPNFTEFPNLKDLNLPNNKFSGELPDLSHLDKLEFLVIRKNELGGVLPAVLPPNLRQLWGDDNQFIGVVPNWTGNNRFLQVFLEDNQISGLPDFTTTTNSLHGISYNLYNNKITFEDILPNIQFYEDNQCTNEPCAKVRIYGNRQQNIYQAEFLLLNEGESHTIDLAIDEEVNDNIYTWIKDGTHLVEKIGDNSLTISNFSSEDRGIYICQVTNPQISELVLTSHEIRVNDAALSLNNIHLNGIAAVNFNYLNWQIPDETRIYSLELQFSLNEPSNWNHLYQVTDNYKEYRHYVSTNTVFYRFKIVTEDNQVNFSPTIVIKREGDLLQKFSIYPNPVTDVVNIKLPKLFSEKIHYRIFSARGEQLTRQTIFTNNNDFSIPVEELSQGLYILQINTDGYYWVKRFIKK